MPKAVRWVTIPSIVAYAKMVRMMMRPKGASAKEIAEETGLTYLTACRYTAALHQQHAAYICGFDIDARGAMSIRRFKIGDDEDVIPPPRSRATRAREQRHREALNPRLREIRT